MGKNFDDLDDSLEELKEDTTEVSDKTSGEDSKKGSDYEDVCFMCRRSKVLQAECLNCRITCVFAMIVCIRPWIW